MNLNIQVIADEKNDHDIEVLPNAESPRQWT